MSTSPELTGSAGQYERRPALKLTDCTEQYERLPALKLSDDTMHTYARQGETP